MCSPSWKLRFGSADSMKHRRRDIVFPLLQRSLAYPSKKGQVPEPSQLIPLAASVVRVVLSRVKRHAVKDGKRMVEVGRGVFWGLIEFDMIVKSISKEGG